MQQLQLRKAARQKAKIRAGLAGPSGSGKTITALLIAYGITGDWNKIALIDTENRSADLYANHTIESDGKTITIGEFQKIDLGEPYTPERYIEALNACVNGEIECVIVDSITHEWNGKGGCLEEHEKEVQRMKIPNSFTAWAKITPRHQKFVETILQMPVHVITTVRSKAEYVLSEKNGKQVPQKVGMASQTRDGFEYELTVSLELDLDHKAHVSKDRTGLFSGKPATVPTINTGKMILDWCESGIDIEEALNNAIAGLINCTTKDDFSMHKEIQPEFVQNHPRYIEAVKKRWAEVRPDNKPMTKEQLQQHEADLNEAIEKLKGCSSVDELNNVRATQPDWIRNHGRFVETYDKLVVSGIEVKVFAESQDE